MSAVLIVPRIEFPFINLVWLGVIVMNWLFCEFVQAGGDGEVMNLFWKMVYRNDKSVNLKK
jgi:hypothetical protein